MTNSSKRNAERLEALRVFPTPEPEFGVEGTHSLFGRLRATLKTMRANVRQRRELGELSEYALRDIGLTRAQVVAELAKPAWR
jgi:uncharacterized protein YjiS (DUF1127 family)